MAVLDAKLFHGGNPLLRWPVANASVATDPVGNRKLDKLRSRGRIDPAVACIMAMGQATRAAAPVDYSLAGMLLAI